MRKVIIALLTSMLCVLSVEAQIFSDRFIEEDTLPQRVVNGLEVVPIRSIPLYRGKYITGSYMFPISKRNFNILKVDTQV